MDTPSPTPHRLFIRTALVIISLTLGLQLYAAVAATSDVLPSLAILGTSLLLSLIPLSFLHKKSLVYWLMLLFPIPVVILLMKFGGIYFGDMAQVFFYAWPLVFILVAALNHRRFVTWRRKSLFVLICIGIGGTGQCLYLHNQKYSWYGAWISFSVIQFGDIDGDGKTDLITSGYKGMSGGNPRWYRGNGKDFGDWEENTWFATPQASPLMVELNGAGQIDMIDSGMFYENKNGAFLKAGEPTGKDPTGISFFSGNDYFLTMHWIAPSGLYFHADLDNDQIEEVFCFGEGRLIFCYREKGSWVTRSFAMPTLFDVRDYHLSFSADVSKAALDLIKSKKWPYRVCPVPANSILPSEQNAYSPQEKHLIDLDGDGLDELAICALDEVKIYRQIDGEFRNASTLKHSGRELMLHRDYFFWIEQFGDLNGDGRIDFLSQEGEVFLCDKDLQFHSAGKLPVRLPSRERDRCKLVLFDINDDGKLDIISSFQPWESVILGPLVHNSKAKP